MANPNQGSRVHRGLGSDWSVLELGLLVYKARMVQNWCMRSLHMAFKNSFHLLLICGFLIVKNYAHNLVLSQGTFWVTLLRFPIGLKQ